MHRSGTSLLAEMLRQAGVFMGWRRDVHCEPHYIRQLNDWLLFQSGGSWDYPTPLADFLRDQHSVGLAADYVDLRLRSPASVQFWGRYALSLPESIPWGWKEPRTTVTLPVWQQVFPAARYINVMRHGVDVAASLVTRHGESQDQRTRVFARHRPLYRLFSRRGGFSESYRCSTLAGAMAVWEEYCQACQQHLDGCTQPCLEVRYERLLSEPLLELQRIIEFLELEVPEPRLRGIAGEANPARAFAYRRNEQAAEFSRSVASRLSAFGYEA